MSGRKKIRLNPAGKASSPASTKRSGRLMAGPLAPSCIGPATGVWGLAAANIGDKAAIGLLFCFSLEAAGFQLVIKVHWPAVCVSVERGTLRKLGKCFEDFHEWFRRHQSACVDSD